MQNLNDIDFQILAFIYQNEPVHISKIQKHFPKISALEHRLNKLCKLEIGTFGMPLPNSSYVKEQHSATEKDDKGLPVRLGIYETTDFGKTTAQDYLHSNKSHQKDVRRSWIQFWVPVVISIFSLIGAYRQELAWLLQEIVKLMK